MAAGSTYTPISTATLGSSAASYTFTSIPTTYTDLILEITNAKSTVLGYGYTIGVGNGSIDTGTNYSGIGISGNTTTVNQFHYSNTVGSTWVAGWLAGMGTTGNDPSTVTIQINNYSNSTTYKQILSRFSSVTKSVEASTWLWRSTSPINTLVINSQSGASILAGTTLTLYGITAA